MKPVEKPPARFSAVMSNGVARRLGVEAAAAQTKASCAAKCSKYVSYTYICIRSCEFLYTPDSVSLAGHSAFGTDTYTHA